MARLRFLALAVTLALLPLLGAQLALGATIVESTGKIGTWTIADSATEAALRCTYNAGDLTAISVAGPTVFGRNAKLRRVELQIDILRNEWWQEFTTWSVVDSSGVQRQRASRSHPVTFDGIAWSVPADLRGPYESFRVRVTMTWYGKGARPVVGTTSVDLDYFGYQEAGQELNPADIVGPDTYCAGTTTPQPSNPPDVPDREPPLGFPRMSHWVAFWKGWSEARVQSTIDELTRMHQTGVVLMGMQWEGKRYALPADVAHYLTMFRAAGIRPYLALFVSKFDQRETNLALRAWDAGEDQWDGIILDVEAGFEHRVQNNPGSALAALDTFMQQVRPLTPMLAYSSWSQLASHPDLTYEAFNSYCDLFMPQAYLRAGHQSATLLLDAIDKNFALAANGWAKPPIPMLPVVNDWGANVKLDQLSLYARLSFQRYGAVSGWRVHRVMREDVKDLWGTFPG